MAKLSIKASEVAARRKFSKVRGLTKTPGERLPRPGMLKASDVVAIPLSDGRFAYGRIYFPVSIAVLQLEPTTNVLSLDAVKSSNSGVGFFAEYYEPIDHPEWVYLGKWPFTPSEESKGPPVYIEDKIRSHVYIILDNGTHREASKDEVIGMQKHGPKAPEQIKTMIELYFKEWPSNPACVGH